jgi:DNA invertase Pin-like site-specific DNA recombinase
VGNWAPPSKGHQDDSGEVRRLPAGQHSTARQGQSGLGLEAQRQAVAEHVNGHGALLGEYVEVESGKRNDRPELAKALAHAKATGAMLIIAKLDRLARNVAFISALMESGVDFVAADMPMANRLTVHVLAAVAEHEAKMISERTKAGLAAAKARGTWVSRSGRTVTRLGNPNGARVLRGLGNDAAVAAIKAGADRHAAQVAPVIAAIRAEGITSNKQTAVELNRRGILTPRGGRWHTGTVRDLLARLDAGKAAG